MTVSLALRDHPSISPGTRLRLKKLAADQGYRPDPAVAKLMQHLRGRRTYRARPSLCGLRMQPPPVTAQGYDYGQQAVDGARQRAESLGYGFEDLHIDQTDLTPRRLQRILSSRGVEGIVLLPMRRPVKLDHLLDWPMFSVVAATSSVLTPRVHKIVPDQFGNMLQLCRHLEAHDRSRLGLATHADHDVRVEHRIAAALGWYRASRRHESIPPLIVNRGGLDGDALLRWVEAHRIQAIASDSEFDVDLIAQALPARVRRQLEFVSTSVHPPLARHLGINERPEEVGAAAVESLAGMIQRGERGLPTSARTTLIAGDLAGPASRAGGSVRRANRKSGAASGP